MATSDKTKTLFKLGAVENNQDWHDYLQYGFNESDVPALLALVADDSFNQANTKSKEVWVPLHAWRALGQIASTDAVEPLTELFDTLFEDHWALSELSVVMGMIGEAAIRPLANYLNEQHHDEFARVIAVDGLAEIAKRQPTYRMQVIQCYQHYMSQPDESTDTLNGILIGCLLDLDATEAIDDIRQLFEKKCVDISCAGDLEEVEIELNLRDERTTPKPNFAQLHGLLDLPELKKPSNDDIFELLNYYLMYYGHDDSILDVFRTGWFFCRSSLCTKDNHAFSMAACHLGW